MAKMPDIEQPITFFQPADAAMIVRILDRACAADAAASLRQSKGGRAASPSLLAQTLGKALAYHGRSGSGRPSIRQTSSAGRTFHFAHRTVTRATTPGSTANKPSAGSTITASASAATGSSTRATARSSASSVAPAGQASAHQAYIERGGAVAPDLQSGHEKIHAQATGRDLSTAIGSTLDRGLGPDASLDPPKTQDHDAAPSRLSTKQDLSWERERTAGGLTHQIDNATAVQSYIENPGKLADATTSSFGNIGETAEERLAFWDLLTAHERKRGARIQTRLVLELPHEASPAARHEIVRRYVEPLAAAGIPFWAVIHIPTNENDPRNHHAHVVYSERPARRMLHPETGQLVWDFTIAESHKTASRNTRVRYPHRQNRLPETRDIDYVTKSRARFADITNAVMQEYGCAVRYDPRSYRSMGIDVEPMRNVSRVLTDKIKLDQFVVMDAGWTRRMIDQETEAAAQNRDVTLRRLRSIDQQLTAVAQTVASINVANKRLPAKLRLSPTSTLTRRAAAALSTRMLTAERERLRERFAAEATRRTLVHIVEATAPHKARGAAKLRVYAKNPDTPDPEILRLIHLSATEELRLFDAWAGSRRTGRNRAATAALDAWQAQAQPAATAPIAAAYEPLRARNPAAAGASRATQPAPDTRTPTTAMPTPEPQPIQATPAAPPKQAAPAHTTSAPALPSWMPAMPRQHPALTAMYAPMLAMAENALINHVQGDNPGKAVMDAMFEHLALNGRLKAAHPAPIAPAAQAPVPAQPGPPQVATPARAATHDARRAPPSPQAASPTYVDPAVTRPARAEPRAAPAASPRAPAPERSDPPMTSMFIPRAPAPRGPAKPAERAAPIPPDLEPTPLATAPAKPAPEPNFKPQPGAPSGLISAYERAVAAIEAGRQSAGVTPAPPIEHLPSAARKPVNAARPVTPSTETDVGLQPTSRAAIMTEPKTRSAGTTPEAPVSQNAPAQPHDRTDTDASEEEVEKKKARRRAIIARDNNARKGGYER